MVGWNGVEIAGIKFGDQRKDVRKPRKPANVPLHRFKDQVASFGCSRLRFGDPRRPRLIFVHAFKEDFRTEMGPPADATDLVHLFKMFSRIGRALPQDDEHNNFQPTISSENEAVSSLHRYLCRFRPA
jgi:hypothetical protein